VGFGDSIQVIPPLNEARPDTSIVFELACLLGLGDKFWNGDIDTAFNYQLAPSGITVEDLRKKPGGIFTSLPVKYEKYRQTNANNQAAGFNTPTGKIEIYSENFLLNGYDPLPNYREPLMSPFSQPELAQKYPLILTNAKLQAFCHGQHRGMPTLRKIVPHPYVEIHPKKAEEMGIKEGEWVILETPSGAIQVISKLKEENTPASRVHPARLLAGLQGA
jgi:anaerobic selenocysteine-containing dehydrogenase